MKRILSLDGGGIRGIFTLQVLARIEELCRAARGRPDLVLRDEFDLFAGTSTGAIIATCLAWGMPVAHVERLYVERGRQMFAPAPWHARWRSKYRAEAIAAFFREHFAEDGTGAPALLGTDRLRQDGVLKLLLIVMRNATTGSPWPVSNNPAAMYNNRAHPDCNLNVPLWQLLRASTAAPTYFLPEALRISQSTHLFIDGGVTAFNNPSLPAILMATLPCYHVEWKATASDLLVVSIGTGSQPARMRKRSVDAVNWFDQAMYVPGALMGSVAEEQDLMCRVLGECRFGAALDSEIGDLKDSGLLTPAEKKFSYVRYNRKFDREDLESLSARDRTRFTLDNLALIPFLQEAGRTYAEKNVKVEDVLPDVAAR
jgi:hypothetical protein